MILGIISLVIFIMGFILFIYGCREDIDALQGIGILIAVIGICGVVSFIEINIDIVKTWFKI